MAQTIAAALGVKNKKDGYMEGNGYLVSWCVGHLVGLSEAAAYGEPYKKWSYDSLPILPQEWKYTVAADKEKQFNTLKELMHWADVSEVVNACDAGREGELIFRFVYEMADCKKPMRRLWISSMEEAAIKEGFAHLKNGGDYDTLFASALCRAKADWLIGINATRLFSVLYNHTLNVGRVQTPTLKMLVDRDAAITTFKKEKYYHVRLALSDAEAASERISNKAEADALKMTCEASRAVCTSLVKEKKTAAPPKLFDLTSLQREANHLFGYTAKQTLDLAQALYEKKLLTYPRTDSNYLTDDMSDTAAGIIKLLCEKFSFMEGADFTPELAKVLNSKKVSDHHAIIPTMELAKTDPAALPESERNILTLAGARLLMDELQNIKTAIHEIAHATLHDIDKDAPERPDRRTREVQAESVAYAVCQHYGLDTSDYSFGYIAGWSSGKELTELKGSLETIRNTAASLIDTIDGHFAEIQKAQDKEQTAEQAQPTQKTITPPEADALELPEETAPVQEKEAQTEPEADTGASSETPQPPQPEQAAPAAPYYTINEAAAKRAKDMNSFSDYKQGSATAEYRHYVDEAVQLAERQKRRVDPIYYEKIDSLLDTYSRKLAANMNKGYEIDARVPSILIAGGSNFPTRKKEKQNAARDSNYREWQDIQGLLDKIRSTGMGGISADDPQAVQKLEKKLESLEKSQGTMKAVNAYYRKHKTLDGCPHLPPEELEKLKADMASSWHLEDKPFATWALSNNSAEIRRVKDRIKSLSQQKEIGFVGLEFDGGKVEANTEANRLQIFFEDKPDEATREALKSNGFRWSPKAGAWQRQLTSNAYYAADYVKAIAPLTGEKPTELQRAHIRQQKVAAQEQSAQEQPEQEAPQDKDTFSIYQIKGGDETKDLRFEPYDRLTAAGHRVDVKNYALVYSAPLTPGTSLEDIYTCFNIDHPKDFKGHSLSVSDVVVLHQNRQDTAHYVDSFGYKEVPEFFKEQEKALIPDELETGETIKTPRGTFYVTAMSRAQMEAAGYGLHHQSDDGKYLIMGNGTQAFAIAAEQPENYLKTAEQTTEQNYNMIDGQINNTPTAAELEEKAKAGGQISLAEYAEALKAEKKQTEPEKKPSIRAQLRADKEKTAQKKAAKTKNHELEV